MLIFLQEIIKEMKKQKAVRHPTEMTKKPGKTTTVLEFGKTLVSYQRTRDDCRGRDRCRIHVMQGYL